MKKIYQIPEIEVMLMEAAELMQASETVDVFTGDDEEVIDPMKIMSREIVPSFEIEL